MSSAVSRDGNPFPGLRSFEPNQAHLFFGRDEQIRDLISRLKQRRFLPIVGMSGSGKSSLVRAGLIPALTGSYVATELSGWRIAVLRPGRNPMNELAAILCREFAVNDTESVAQTLRTSSAGLARVAHQLLGSKEKLLVLVDQFEELFRYRQKADEAGETDYDAAFVKLLLAAAGEGELPLAGLENLPVYVITTMRSDFLGMCSRFRGLPEALNQSQYLIPRLTREQQREVIEGPVGMAGAEVEPALVQRLLNDLGDNPDQLPALQHALMRTWEQSAPARSKGNPISVADYEAVGGMADALNRDADRLYESLSTSDATATITRRLFQRLVWAFGPDNETRSPTPLSELVAVTAAEESDVNQVINIFQERGFLTVSRDRDPIIDITHESLIRGWQRLKTWVEEESRYASIYVRLADQAGLYAVGEASLFVDPQLQLTLNWREETKPNEAWAARYDTRFVPAMEFLEQSQKARQDAIEHHEQWQRRELKRARLTTGIFGALLLVTIAVMVFAFIQWKATVEERDRRSRLLYDSNIYFASSAVASGQFTLAQERLSELLDDNLKQLRGFEWFHLWRTVNADDATLVGHSNYVLSVAYSPDGKILASASGDKTVKLWDTTTRKEVATLSGHSDAIWAVAYSPDGKTLASASTDQTVKLWDIAGRKEIATLTGHTGDVCAIAFSPDGKTLASASIDQTVKLWDTASHRVIAVFSGHSGGAWAVAFSPDGKTLASAGVDKTVKLWDTASRKETATLIGHNNAVWTVAFSPDGQTLASGSSDKTVRYWNPTTHKQIGTISGHLDRVTSVAFSPDGETLASASHDKTVKLWRSRSRQEVATLSSHTRFVRGVAFSPDSKTLASASNDETVKLWDTITRKEIAVLYGHTDAIWAIAISPDGQMLVSASDDQTVKFWNTVARKEIATFSGHAVRLVAVAFSPDGKTFVTTGIDKTVKLWDVASFTEIATLSGHSERVVAVAFSPDGKTLATASHDKTVKLWDTGAHTEVANFTGHSDQVRAVAFSPDGKTLASASNDKTVKLWDIAKRQEVTTLYSHSDYVLALAYSLDGKTLASASGDQTVKLWDTASFKEIANFSGHSGPVLAVALSPDGKTLASASDDATVKLWDIAGRTEVATLYGHSAPVWSLIFSPDGKMLASAGQDNAVILWFAATDKEVEEQLLRGH